MMGSRPVVRFVGYTGMGGHQTSLFAKEWRPSDLFCVCQCLEVNMGSLARFQNMMVTTLPETNIFSLKMDGRFRFIPYWNGPFLGAMFVLGTVSSLVCQACVFLEDDPSRCLKLVIWDQQCNFSRW